MRLLAVIVVAVIASCYSPRVDRCRVTCTDLCPAAQDCLDDGFCHAAGDTELCELDAEPPPPIDAEPDAEIPDAEVPDAELTPPRVFGTIAAGGHHACAIDGDGALWCWGSNRRGQIGQGPGVVRATAPVQVGTDLTWTAVDAGEDHTCGIKAGALYCWGANSYGEAIDTEGGSGNVYLIGEADSGPNTGWVALTTGATHTCAIHDDGAGLRTIYCAGHDGYGQLGDSGGDASGPTLRAIASTTDGPVTDWSAIQSSDDHTCALRPSGEAYCWGLNQYGQVGDGVTTTNRVIPTRVVATMEDGAVAFGAISPGGVMTCAVGAGVALGRLYCWGANGYGQLGDPSVVPATVPRRIGTATDWSTVAASYIGICGVRADGVWCWGDGGYGNVGNGAWSYASTPQHVVGLDVTMPVAVGYHFACAAPTAGGARCWGENVEGELGDGTSSTKHEPTVIAPVDGQWSAVATAQHQTCGIHAGVVRCWGWNESRQVLGVASADAVLTPTAVAGLPAGTATSVSAGNYVSCAIIDEGGGEVHPWCWGFNNAGELGVGATGQFRTPSEVSNTGVWTGLTQTERATCALVGTERRCWGNGNGYGLGNNSVGNVLAPAAADVLDWSKVRLGGFFGCGIRATTGELWCWGSDSYGKQGNGAGATVGMTPQRVGTSTFTDVATAWYGDHACAIEATTQDLICWGLNSYGQCGLSTSVGTDLESPMLVDDGTWTAIAAGQGHTCGIQTDGLDVGQLWCWGTQSDHQLGIDVQQAYFEAPERIGTDLGWTAVAAGARHTCGLRGGNLYCWGANMHGQIGDGTASHATPVEVMFP